MASPWNKNILKSLNAVLDPTNPNPLSKKSVSKALARTKNAFDNHLDRIVSLELFTLLIQFPPFFLPPLSLSPFASLPENRLGGCSSISGQHPTSLKED